MSALENKAILLLVLFSVKVSALDLTDYENQCEDIGFKKKTPAFGECVLELIDRKNKAVAVTEEDQVCQKYGFRLGTAELATCKQQIDMAKQASIRQEEQYRNQKRQYEELVEIQRERERREKAQRALDLSLRLMNGQNPTDAMLGVGTGAPIAPRMPAPQTIILPNGRGVTCTTQNNVTTCF